MLATVVIAVFFCHSPQPHSAALTGANTPLHNPDIRSIPKPITTHPTHSRISEILPASCRQKTYFSPNQSPCAVFQKPFMNSPKPLITHPKKVFNVNELLRPNKGICGFVLCHNTHSIICYKNNNELVERRRESEGKERKEDSNDHYRRPCCPSLPWMLQGGWVSFFV